MSTASQEAQFVAMINKQTHMLAMALEKQEAVKTESDAKKGIFTATRDIGLYTLPPFLGLGSVRRNTDSSPNSPRATTLPSINHLLQSSTLSGMVGIHSAIKSGNDFELEVSPESDDESEDDYSDESDIESQESCEKNHPRAEKRQHGEVYDLIHGRKRQKLCIEDSEKLQMDKYCERWDKLVWEQPLHKSGHICGYEEGDRHLEFAEWQEEKAKRVCQPGQIRDPISGQVRQRIMMDSSPEKHRDTSLSAKWDRLRQELDHGPQARRKIWGYRRGDLELSWEELKEARATRAGWWL